MDTIKIDSGKTKMVAHRGVSGLELENTCSAFVAAGTRSYYGIETDVHVTSDGKYIIFHDDTTERVGLDKMTIEETTFETLRKLTLADKDGKRGRIDLVMPSLEEYINICKKYEKKAVLELKNEFTKEQVYEIVEIIDSLGWLDNTIFISFEIVNLQYLREKYPEQEAQYLSGIYTDYLIDTVAEMKLDIDILYSTLTEERVNYIHSKGVKINCWTCDDPEYAKNLVKWGVEYITSNIIE